MKPVLHQSHGIHRGDENRRKHEPVIERRPEEKGGQQEHRSRADRELHKAFHARSVAQTHGIR